MSNLKDVNRMILIVSGTRKGRIDTWYELDLLQGKISLLITGGAPGVDFAAEKWAEQNGVTCIVVPAQWDYYGKSAGTKRNRDMLLLARRLAAGKGAARLPLKVLCLPAKDSVGTRHMATIARGVADNVEVIEP